MTLSVRTVRLRGLEFTWYEGGVRDAPPVLLLHGLGRDGTDWLPVWHGLGAAHRLLALDQRGHGGSARPPEYSFGLLREDAVALLDALDVSRVGLVGHSMGGTVACLLAQEHPGRVDRLVLEDTPPPRGRREYQPPPEQPPTPVSYDWRMAAPLRRELAEPDPAWWQRLARITAPSLVLGGGPSSHIDQAELAAVAAAVPDCRLVTIPDAGHSIHARRPAEFLAAVVPFLT